jgi:hypothetical protein
MIIILLICAIIVVYIFYQEKKDIAVSEDGKLKGDGYGRLYYAGKGSSDDSIQVLINKINFLSLADSRTKMWRRYFIGSFIISIIVTRTIYESNSILDFLMTFLVSFITMFGLNAYYTYHCSRYVLTYIKENLNLLTLKT